MRKCRERIIRPFCGKKNLVSIEDCREGDAGVLLVSSTESCHHFHGYVELGDTEMVVRFVSDNGRVKDVTKEVDYV